MDINFPLLNKKMASLWLANKCLIGTVNTIAPNSSRFSKAQTI